MTTFFALQRLWIIFIWNQCDYLLGVECPEPFITMPQQPKEQRQGQLPREKIQEFFDQVRLSNSSIVKSEYES